MRWTHPAEVPERPRPPTHEVGSGVGWKDGRGVGLNEGCCVGSGLGWVGSGEGSAEGAPDGRDDGRLLGRAEGSDVGPAEGAAEGI